MSRILGGLAAAGRALVFLAVAAVTVTGLAAAVLGSLWWQHRARGRAGP
ncbi:MAG TPA: hypothetical protein VEY12_05440 [Thermoplasmata archaeon]|nr:hypothetical protein [Thermoplasmata archaeon]